MEVSEVRDLNNEIDLSIIVPCHNLENFINPLLVSLRLQVLLFYKAELIFVCDNCTDNTVKRIQNFNFNELYENVTILEVKVNSAGIARNKGFEVAKGKYIWFVDGDDWLIDIHAIPKLINALAIRNVPVIRFAYEAPGFTAIGDPSMPWQYGYRKDFIEDIKFVWEQPHEDAKFNTEVFQKYGKQADFINETLYHYNYLRVGSNMYNFYMKK